MSRSDSGVGSPRGGNRSRACSTGLPRRSSGTSISPSEARLFRYVLKAEIGDEIAALVLDREGTLDPLERRLGVLIAERRGPLVIGFGGILLLRTAAALDCEGPHPLERAGMILRGRLLKQRPRTDVVLLAAGAFRHHHAELVLRFRIGLGGFFQQLPRSGRVGRRTATAERRQIADASRIAGLCGALEQFAGLRLVLGDARTGAIEHAELNHRRGRAPISRLAPGG